MSRYGNFITACNKDPSVVDKSGAQNLPFMYFKINNDLGYDFDLKIISTSLYQSIDKFTSTASFTVSRGTILQLINRNTNTIRQIIPYTYGPDHSEITISQIPICTTVPVCGTPIFSPSESINN